MRLQRTRIGPRVGIVAVGALAALTTYPTFAQDTPGASGDVELLQRELKAERARLDALKAELFEQQRKLEKAQRALDEQRSRIDELLAPLSGRGTAPRAGAGKPPALAVPATAPVVAPETAQASQQDAPGDKAPPKPVGEAPQDATRSPEVAQIFDEPTALTPRGKFVLDPSFQYVRSTDNRIALVGFTIIPAITIGVIDVRRVARDIYSFALTGRYGLTPRFEVEAKVPYVSASSSTLTRALNIPTFTDEVFDARGSGIGDVEVAARWQINQFRGDNPLWIATLRYKFNTGKGPFEVRIDPTTGLQAELPTGTGFNAVQPGFTFLVPSDPAVFFGGAAYTYSFPRDVGNGFGRIAPGGITDINLGMGLALNERASFSIGYQHSIVGRTVQSGVIAPDRTLVGSPTLQLGTMRFGVSYRFTPKLNMNLSLGIGVTDDSPDFEATLRVPYTF